MRKFYSFLIYLITPLVLAYLFFRGLRSEGYLKRWPERFALFKPLKNHGGIVVHAVSMGEVNAASPLIRELAKRYSTYPLCVTTFTPTGSERVSTLFGSSVTHVYLPLDLPGAVRRFFDRVQPRLLIIMETEIWPNLYNEAYARNIPIMIANARISDRSIGRYRRLRKFTATALEQVSQIAAQSTRDADRLIEIGAKEKNVVVTGNLKFDVHLPPSLIEYGDAIRLSWGTDRLVLLAGSTHEGDEGPLLEAFQGVLKSFPDALLVVVPRHPERFGRAAQLARSVGLQVAVRSESIVCPRNAQCYIVDLMGELLRYYAACDVAFVGGSLEAIGGQNVLEPAALCKPVIVGPHTFNFEDITRQLIDNQAAIRIQNAAELEVAICQLFSEPELRDRMGQQGSALVKSGQGALDRTLALLDSLLNEAAD